jgi:hypothetical protein
MMQGKIYHLKNPIMVAARNAVMRYTNVPGNDLKKIHQYDADEAIQVALFSEKHALGFSPADQD